MSQLTVCHEDDHLEFKLREPRSAMTSSISQVGVHFLYSTTCTRYRAMLLFYFTYLLFLAVAKECGNI